jgi:hypothetical protein
VGAVTSVEKPRVAPESCHHRSISAVLVVFPHLEDEIIDLRRYDREVYCAFR